MRLSYMAGMLAAIGMGAAGNNVKMQPTASEQIVTKPGAYRLQYISPGEWFRGRGRGRGKPRKSNRLHMAKAAKIRRRKAARG